MKKKLVYIIVLMLILVTFLTPVMAYKIEKTANIDLELEIQKPKEYKPSAREAHDMVYDSKHSKVILFGGIDGNGNYLDDTWVYDYDENSWTNMNPSKKPSPRAYHAMAYDRKHDITLLHGGLLENGEIDDEAWIYDYSANSWTKIDTWSELYGHEICYDSYNDRFIIYGGANGDGLSGWTHLYDYEKDTRVGYDPYWCPPERYLFSMVYDNTYYLTFAFGGGIYIISLSDDMYCFQKYPGGWEWEEAFSAPNPSARFGHSMVFDSNNYCFILFGGADFNKFMDDTWSGRGDESFFVWENRNPSNKPSARWLHSMVYDSEHEKTILFGGNTSSGCSDELWTYDYTSNTWIELHPKAKPYLTNKIDNFFERFLHRFPMFEKILNQIKL